MRRPMPSHATVQRRQPRRGVLAICTAAGLSLTACGGSDDGPVQLSPATGATLSGACTELAAKLGTLSNTSITASTTVPAGTLKVAGNDVPEHCLVTGKMAQRTSTVDGQSYAIGFEMRLPKAWNGRFYHQGNGGIDGSVVTATGSFGGGPTTHALLQGFAVLSSDAGHAGSLGPTFGIDPQARLDYGYQAVGKLTPMAKSLIQTAYGKGPDRSYFGGCSNGGRHTMVTAARYADQYDGYVVGAPGFNLPKAAVANIFGAQRYATVATNPADVSTAFTAAERATVANAVLAKCDALDGVTDGLVQDTTACQKAFSLATDVPTCTAERNGSCLSAAQKTAIAPIFSGATTSTGAAVYASFPYDSGLGAAGIAFWEFTAPLALDSGAVGMIFKVPPEPVAGFNGPVFSLTSSIDTLVAQINATNATYTESAMSFMTPPNPTDLSKVKSRGGKMIVYHGVSDAIFSVNDTTSWYEGVSAANNGDATGFARFFRVPGMGHCSGGPATDQFDLVSAIVAWVEQGKAPDSITATARGAGNAGGVNAELPAAWSASRSRPLCPYPKVARYKGTGDVESAGNFSCQ
ncbi:tannase/feruloyl esterase family alpha/beta hydrolase [Aquabacterium sp.]|uniref:tannase/feruloyl esterase family alpha/beta hydrolase n=1 Tax=Aquabacterium sp. TaxID=1872578 RepID=UPI002BD9CA60|nr:tannase/feruloyl esterase family alpha/beta hydrolase [Aquabacterium sp.]HSW08938.1 tannase/feruloyl esterase family alpha/beta hydrolase [Aquabacterium sp.]